MQVRHFPSHLYTHKIAKVCETAVNKCPWSNKFTAITVCSDLPVLYSQMRNSLCHHFDQNMSLMLFGH